MKLHLCFHISTKKENTERLDEGKTFQQNGRNLIDRQDGRRDQDKRDDLGIAAATLSTCVLRRSQWDRF